MTILFVILIFILYLYNISVKKEFFVTLKETTGKSKNDLLKITNQNQLTINSSVF